MNTLYKHYVTMWTVQSFTNQLVLKTVRRQSLLFDIFCMICMSVCSFSTNLIVTPWRLPHLSFGGFPGQQARVVLAISSILLPAERKWIYESSLKVMSAGHTRHLFQDFYWQHARFQRFGESNNRKQFGTNIYIYIYMYTNISYKPQRSAQLNCNQGTTSPRAWLVSLFATGWKCKMM